MKNRLKVLRAERDWSQADLAQRLDVSRQSVNAIETGKYDPSLPLAFRIARTFGSLIRGHARVLHGRRDLAPERPRCCVVNSLLQHDDGGREPAGPNPPSTRA